MRRHFLSSLILLCAATTAAQSVSGILPITGTWINFAYKDVRNKYTNPAPESVSPSAAMWGAKVDELADIGMEYLVIMEVANEGRAYYPSSLMEHAWPADSVSPLDAVLDRAAARGLKVFLSSGWAKDQDDNLRDPAIRNRQLEIMDELAALYRDHEAFYGWYLPVEDCLCPVMSQHAVDAVNSLVDHARGVAPGKKVLISPYGIFMSDFDDPEYEKRLAQLKVDIIAYQDEVGCVRVDYPLPDLRRNWRRLRDIHDRIGIEMWANCETFTWERGPNSRESALVPADYQRLLAQQAAASAGGVSRIISFMFPGIIENPSSRWKLGQPEWSGRIHDDYEAWRHGDAYWTTAANAMTGDLAGNVAVAAVNPADNVLVDGLTAELTPADKGWRVFDSGEQSVDLAFASPVDIGSVVIKTMSAPVNSIRQPDTVTLSVSADGREYSPVAVAHSRQWPNDRLDCRPAIIVFDNVSATAPFIRLTFTVAPSSKTAIDEVYVNQR